MTTGEWNTRLREINAKNLTLILASILCVQILSAVRDPIVIGLDLPSWLMPLNAALIAIGLVLVLWARWGSGTETFAYPIISFAFFCAGLKATAAMVAQGEALPFYVAVLMLSGSLCFLSIRYLTFNMIVVLLTWTVVAVRVLPIADIVSTLAVALLGAALSLFVLNRRITSARRLFELQQRVETLESILPMCANCKKTRDHIGNWLSIEEYIEENQTGTQISHGTCPSCTKELYGDYLKNRQQSETGS